jgi:hypothetical protein
MSMGFEAKSKVKISRLLIDHYPSSARERRAIIGAADPPNGIGVISNG